MSHDEIEEEVDVLGDNVGILASGQLRALGTPIFLKNRFGVTYHLSPVCEQMKTKKATSLVEKLLPVQRFWLLSVATSLSVSPGWREAWFVHTSDAL